MPKKLILLLLLFSSYLGYAQYHTISGFIEDSESGERLIGVTVFVPGTRYGTTTNTYGFYSLNVPLDTVELQISYIGYQTIKETIILDKDIKKDIILKESLEQLTEVEVYAEEIAAETPQMSTVDLSVKEIKKIPAFLGEVDIIRAIQLLPGVQSGGEGTTGFYVRGGSPDQNLVLLDGVPVYNASHLFGFFSVFNADAIKNVQLTKGGFPARYGGRLSSVLDIALKEGNMKEFHGEGSIGLISSKLTLEGPIWKDRTSFIISGRRTYYDLIIRPFLPDDVDAGYFFDDLNVKINHIFSRKDRLYLSYYGGNDKFFNEEDVNSLKQRQELTWGNNTASLRWNHLFNDKLFNNLTATFTEYEFRVGNQTEDFDFLGNKTSFSQDYFSGIQDVGLRSDLEYIPNTKHHLRFGASYTYHTFSPGAIEFEGNQDGELLDSILDLSAKLFSHDAYAYVEDDWMITQKIRGNIGLHYSVYNISGRTYNSLQPRASFRYLIDDLWSVKASYASMVQYVHLLSNTGLGLPTDLWVSSTEDIAPSQSQQIAIGTTRNFKGHVWETSVEAYYKNMDQLMEYKEGASYFSNVDWQSTVETGGNGRAYGIEFLVRKNKGQTTGWIGYTLAYTNRQFENLNEGRRFAYRYDRRHDVSVVVHHKFTDKIDMGLTWVFGSGIAFTAPLGKYSVLNSQGDVIQEVTRYSDRNAFRLPPYHRMDLGINFHKKTRWGRRTWNISVYNAYNRQNPFFLYITTPEFGGDDEVRQVSLFPIIPSFAYIFSF